MQKTESLLTSNTEEFSYLTFGDLVHCLQPTSYIQPKFLSENLEYMVNEAFIVLVGANNVVLQQDKIVLKVTNHRLVFEFPNSPASTASPSTPSACMGKHADFVPFWYLSAIESVSASKGRSLLQFSLRDSSSFSLLLPNLTEAKAITQVGDVPPGTDPSVHQTEDPTATAFCKDGFLASRDLQELLLYAQYRPCEPWMGYRKVSLESVRLHCSQHVRNRNAVSNKLRHLVCLDSKGLNNVPSFSRIRTSLTLPREGMEVVC